MGLLDFAQAASNTAADTVSGPVDLLALALRKLGVPVPQDPIAGAAWMQKNGFTKPVKQSASSLAGETMGLLAPLGAVAKAPQISRGLLQAGDNLAAPRTLNPQTGAIVWHGSPHKFDKFDSSKIGTGEGAQAYGHGLYLAERQAVADEYAGKLSQQVVDFANKAPTTAAEKRLAKQLESMANSTQYESVAEMVGKSYDRAASPSRDSMFGNSFVGLKPMPPRKLSETLVMQRAAQRLGPPSVGDAGNLYKVDLPDETIARMLDWDKPLSQQAPEVRQAVQQTDWYKHAVNVANGPNGRLFVHPDDRTGADFYKMMADADKQSAATLRTQGIPGIRYLDGGSRGAGAGSSNYVVFPGEEGLLKIIERNGVAP